MRVACFCAILTGVSAAQVKEGNPMPNWICVTCGTQYEASDAPPAGCPVCEDERQYVNAKGQQWTTLDDLRASHHNVVKTEEPGLTGFGSEPKFAIGQRALLVQSPGGNVLWDCISLIDDATIQAVNARGGLSAIAISHPHLYSSMVEWSRAFGGVPIYLHAANRQYVMRPDPVIQFWDGETCALGDGLTLVRCGGHFEGSTVLHWAQGAEGRGALLTGDTIMVVPDRRYVSFMYSYPNLIPLRQRKSGALCRPSSRLPSIVFTAGGLRAVAADGKAAVARSAERYVRAIGG
jgi:glyoxylase-like metal-dependent hydrolase (beta-lactamase superfamily II)